MKRGIPPPANAGTNRYRRHVYEKRINRNTTGALLQHLRLLAH